MEEIEKELNLVFQEHKQKYIDNYDKSEGLITKLKNTENFNIIFESLQDKLILKANQIKEKNNKISKTNIEQNIKDKIIEFSRYIISPF